MLHSVAWSIRTKEGLLIVQGLPLIAHMPLSQLNNAKAVHLCPLPQVPSAWSSGVPPGVESIPWRPLLST